MLKNKIILFAIIVILNFVIDRITKIYVINFFIKNHTVKEFYYNDFLNFILVWNKGIAFGLLGFENILYHLVSFIILCIIILLIYLIFDSNSTFLSVSYSIIVGGALGNLFDRLYYGVVPDYIDFHYNNFHWFTFNFADISVSIGIFLLFFHEIRFKRKET